MHTTRLLLGAAALGALLAACADRDGDPSLRALERAARACEPGVHEVSFDRRAFGLQAQTFYRVQIEEGPANSCRLRFEITRVDARPTPELEARLRDAGGSSEEVQAKLSEQLAVFRRSREGRSGTCQLAPADAEILLEDWGRRGGVLQPRPGCEGPLFRR